MAVTFFEFANAKAIADKLGDAKARAKLVADEIKGYEDALVEYGLANDVDAVNGWKYRVTVTRTERKVSAWKKIATDLGASVQKIAANTKRVAYTAVRCVALKTA